MKKYIIYNDDAVAYEYLNKEGLQEYLNEYDNISKEDAVNDLIQNDFYNLKELLDRYNIYFDYDYILVVADFGLWYGRRKATAQFKTLKEAVFNACKYDTNIVYFDKINTTLQAGSQHHDGCNFYKFYKVVNGKKRAITYRQLLNIL